MNSLPLDVLVVGGGMICRDQILPSLYQLQRLGQIGSIAVCAQTGQTVKRLADAPELQQAFPGHSFTPYPDYRADGDLTTKHPQLFKTLLAAMPPRSLVVMALPDQLHFAAVMQALHANQHVLAVKPLVLTHAEAVAIEAAAFERGLMVGVDYHKRFDDRVLMARQLYRDGRFGQFRLGQAILFEPWYYRDSNFQNWCTCENTDLFTYVGCHYVDQVHFITGLLPTEISVYGIRDHYPNGNPGFLWTDARILWDNGACLNVVNAIGYPNAAPGGNLQGLRLYCQAADDAALLLHDDQQRGVRHCYATPGEGANTSRYREPNPDFLQLVYRGGTGLTPVGYGYRSIAGIVEAVQRVEGAGDSCSARQAEIRAVDAEGIIATPANSNFNELVIEAARLSILQDGRPVRIRHSEPCGVEFRRWD